MRFLFFSTLFLISFFVKAQTAYDSTNFKRPLSIPLILSGTFGELRSNHFHSGIDIKTQHREGLSINSIEDGIITRIKVSLWGFGKVIYVAHPNGYTSVYAHLQKFSPKLEAYIKKIQYQKKSYEVEVFPNHGELPVKKGDLIAISGNSGSSGGPHLHFEIRNTATERPINPLLFGYKVKDHEPPMLSAVFGYAIGNNSQINKSNKKLQLNIRRQKNGSYIADKIYASGKIGFGIEAIDRQDLAANKNGVYEVSLSVNGTTHLNYNLETFAFYESRYINTFIDFEHYAATRQRIQKCFITPNNPLSIYKKQIDKGIITIKKGLRYSVLITIKDLAGNKTKVTIPVQYKKQPITIKKKIKETDYYIYAKKPNNYNLGVAKIYFPANTFYKNFYANLKDKNDTITIHNFRTGVHKKFTISFDVSKYSKEEQQKLYIGRIIGKGKVAYESTYKRENTFTTRTKNLGTYLIAKDTIAPTLVPKNYTSGKKLNNYKYLKFTIQDIHSGISNYTASLNGKWILLEYEPKTKTLTYNFEDLKSTSKKFDLSITVTDNVGNSYTFTDSFTRKK